MQKRKLIFVGEPNLPVYEMINSSSEFVKNHEVFIIPFSTFHNSILKYLDQDANIVFIGCNYKRVIEFFSYIFNNKDLISKILFFKEVSMLLCDSVKSFWMEFAINNISLFNKLYLLDMPNRHPIFTDNIKFKPIIGLPILQYINNFTFNKSKINILSFAGSIQVYPERKIF